MPAKHPSDPVPSGSGSHASAALLRLVADTVPVMLAYYECPDLRCRFANQRFAGFMERTADGILGTTERRGFQPIRVEGEAHTDGDRWHLRMTVEGQREPEGLQQQLAKLYDCLAVQVQPCA